MHNRQSTLSLPSKVGQASRLPPPNGAGPASRLPPPTGAGPASRPLHRSAKGRRDACPTWAWLLVALFALGLGHAARAFPPAPTHVISGMVRNEMGDPLMVTNAVVILETSTGVLLKTTAVPNLGPGMNYRLAVPMDAGLTSDAYKPTALKPLVSFRMKVIIGATTYLPMELHGNYASLGKPAQTTHLDLTLGEDTNNDGLPDAWEKMLADVLGVDWTTIKPGEDPDHDGLTNLQEYQAGTYAFDPADGLRLDLAGLNQGHPLLDFMVIRGRTYTILASTNLTAWAAVDFLLPFEAPGSPAARSYAASDVRIVRAEVVTPDPTASKLRVFKLMTQ